MPCIGPVTLLILNIYGAAGTKMDLGELGWEGVDQIILTQGMLGSCEDSNESLVSIKCRKFLS